MRRTIMAGLATAMLLGAGTTQAHAQRGTNPREITIWALPWDHKYRLEDFRARIAALAGVPVGSGQTDPTTMIVGWNGPMLDGVAVEAAGRAAGVDVKWWFTTGASEPPKTTIPLVGTTGNITSNGSITFGPSGAPVTTRLTFANNPVGTATIAVFATLGGELACGSSCFNVFLGTSTNAATFSNYTYLPAPTLAGAQGGMISYGITYLNSNGQIMSRTALTVTAAPEPSTYALMATGLLAVGGIAQRKRKA